MYPGRSCCVLRSGLVAASSPEAIAAKHRLAAGGAERDFCGLPAIAASGREHLARATVITAPTATAAAIGPRRLASLTTRRAPFWLGKTALRVEVLLAGSKYELLITVSTNQDLVRVHESPELLSVAAPSVSSRLRVRGRVGVLLGRVRGRPAGYAAGLYVRRWTLHRALPGRHLVRPDRPGLGSRLGRPARGRIQRDRVWSEVRSSAGGT